MRHCKSTSLIVAALFASPPLFSQQKRESSPCVADYENHNQVEYRPLIVQAVNGTVVDLAQEAVSQVCVAIFAEKDHALIATTQSDANGKFSLEKIRPGRYRLVVKADPLCAANVPLRVVKNTKKKMALRVHMKARGLDACSYADLGL